MADDTKMIIDIVAVDNATQKVDKVTESLTQLANGNVKITQTFTQIGETAKSSMQYVNNVLTKSTTTTLTNLNLIQQAIKRTQEVFKISGKNVSSSMIFDTTANGFRQKKSAVDSASVFKEQFAKEDLIAKQTQESEKLNNEIKKTNENTKQETPKLQFGDVGYKEQRKIELSLQNQKKLLDENLKKQLGIKNAAKGFANSIGKAVLSLVTIRKTIGFITSALKKSADWTENLNLFEVTFRNSSAYTMDFALNVQKAYGIAANEIIRYTGLFKQMSEAIGIAENTSTEMSKTLTTLGYDIASLYNISTEKAMEKLQAGIAGQTKPLRSLGLDITAQSLDKYLGDMGLDYTSKMLNQADKMLLRTIVIVDQAKNTYGDMAKTINTFANQVKVFNGSLDNFKMAVGDLIIKPATSAIIHINGFIIAMTNIIRAFVPLSKTSGLNDTAESIGKINETTQDLEKTMSLLSFDKFESLSKGEGGASGINGMLTDEFAKKQAEYMEEFNKQMKEIKNQANEVAKAIQGWLFPNITYKEDGSIDTLGELNDIIVAIEASLATLILVKVGSFLIDLVKKLAFTKGSFDALKLSSNLLLTTGIFAISYGILDLIQNWDKLSKSAKAVDFVIIALGATMIAFSNKALLGSLVKSLTATKTAMLGFKKSIGGVQLAIAGLASVMTFLALDTWFSSMSEETRKFAGTAAIVIGSIMAIVAAVLALKTTISWGIGLPILLAGVGAAIAGVKALTPKIDVKTYAQGGYPDRGQMFIANERGAELVGNIGGRTGVANNDMIVQAIENAAYRGYVRAYQQTHQESGGNQNINLQLDINGREFARATYSDIRAEGKRRGY